MKQNTAQQMLIQAREYGKITPVPWEPATYYSFDTGSAGVTAGVTTCGMQSSHAFTVCSAPANSSVFNCSSLLATGGQSGG